MNKSSEAFEHRAGQFFYPFLTESSNKISIDNLTLETVSFSANRKHFLDVGRKNYLQGRYKVKSKG